MSFTGLNEINIHIGKNAVQNNDFFGHKFLQSKDAPPKDGSVVRCTDVKINYNTIIIEFN